MSGVPAGLAHCYAAAYAARMSSLDLPRPRGARLLLAILLTIPAGACDAQSAKKIEPQPTAVVQPAAATADRPASAFPKPDRPVSAIVSDRWSDEDSRDDAGEAERVMGLLAIRPGMTVADIGAGSGYYTVRLARRVGPTGQVIAEDIMPDYLRRLRARVSREGLRNVRFTLGQPHDPKLPAASIDVALLVHMYHEIEQPFGLLWHLRASLRPGGRVAISDSERPTGRHGTPPSLLRCELAVVGYREIAFHELGNAGGYLAVFEAAGPRPEPAAIRGCES